ncbi:UNVERIFIED_CONTAM: ADP-ribosylation factor 2 [Sesamum calycinum]|uniref:ADP-ribosylation factor 2 n=1 Tax=Sesamum calycinum TaxID=2727403 RepID=A0AAW2R7G9_9LAMI
MQQTNLNAMNAAEITDKLGLHSLRQRHWYTFAYVCVRVCFEGNEIEVCSARHFAANFWKKTGGVCRSMFPSALSQLLTAFLIISARYIQSTCATSGEGLYEGLDWLSNNIANKVGSSSLPSGADYVCLPIYNLIANSNWFSPFFGAQA